MKTELENYRAAKSALLVKCKAMIASLGDDIQLCQALAAKGGRKETVAAWQEAFRTPREEYLNVTDGRAWNGQKHEITCSLLVWSRRCRWSNLTIPLAAVNSQKVLKKWRDEIVNKHIETLEGYAERLRAERRAVDRKIAQLPKHLRKAA